MVSKEQINYGTKFKDAIVLIGPTDVLTFHDAAPTPFDDRDVPKVSVHGNLFKTIVSGRYIRRLPESGAFVVNATAWLDADQQAQIMADTGCPIGPISGGFFTAILSPQGEYLGEPLRSGEGEVIADLDFSLINIRKILMDASGHYSRPELLSLRVDRTPRAHLHDRFEHLADAVPEDADDVRV